MTEVEPVDEKPLARTFSAFRYRDFRLVWISAFTSTTGTWMQQVAQSWIVLQMTGSALYLGIDAFLATLPIILFSLVGGVVADRVDRRRILLVSQYAQMTFAFVLAALIFTKTVKVWHIFVLSFLTGTAQSFGGPAYQALLPLLVGREEMQNAIAMNSMQFNLARMLGPVLAGIALAQFGAATCFALNGLSFVAVIIALLAIRLPYLPETKNRGSMFAEMREGFRFMENNRALALLTVLGLVTTFFGSPLITLLPVVAKNIFHQGAGGYSLLMSVSGAGSIVGALFVAGLGHLKMKGKAALVFQLLFGCALITFALSRFYPLSLVAVFVSGGCLLGVIAVISSLVQLATTEAMRGRVISIFMLAFRGGMPLGNLMAGWVTERTSVTTALLANSIVLLFIAGILLLTKNPVRDM